MIPQALIERALALTWKTIDYVQEYDSHGQNWLSIEKFCYYLLSKPFLEKFYYKADRATEWESLWDMYALFGLAISQYQEGNEEPIISLLEKI